MAATAACTPRTALATHSGVRRETGRLRLAKLAGVTFVNQYVVIKYLGKGANGRVFLCLDMADTRLYAVKVCIMLRPYQ